MLTFITNTRYNEVVVRATSLESKTQFKKVVGKNGVGMKCIAPNHYEARFKLRKLSPEKQDKLFNLMDNNASFYVEKWDKE